MQGEPRTRNETNTGFSLPPRTRISILSLRKKRYWQGTLLFSDRFGVLLIGRSIVGLVSGGHTDDENKRP
jgi:hypothetical protein